MEEWRTLSNRTIRIATVMIGISFGFLLTSGSAAAFNDTWTQYQNGPDHTGFQDIVGPTANDTEILQDLSGLGLGGLSGVPTLDEDAIYLTFTSWIVGGPEGLDDRLLKYSRADGSLVWEHEFEKELWSGLEAPVIYEDLVLVSRSKRAHDGMDPSETVFGQVFAFDRDTGTELWTYQIDMNRVTQLLAFDGKVYVGLTGNWYDSGSDYYALCLDINSGNVVWQTELPERPTTIPAASEGTIIFQTEGRTLYAFSSTGLGPKAPLARYPEGKLLWSETYDEVSGLSSTPMIHGGSILMFNSAEGAVLSLDMADGSVEWQASLQGILRGSCIHNGSLAITANVNDDGATYLLDMDTGTIKWNTTVGTNLAHEPVCASNGIYMGGNNGANTTMTMVSPDGEIVWTGYFNDTIISTGALADGRLYTMGMLNDRLAVFDGVGHLVGGDTTQDPQGPMGGYVTIIVLILVGAGTYAYWLRR